MKLSQLKEFIKTVVKEEQDYEELFQSMLAKTGKNIPDMSDDEKKKFFNDVDDSYKAKSESVNESDMDAKLPKDLLIQVVEALIIQVITQASTRKINIPASDIESLRNNLKKEINSGKITTVGQIMKTIQKLHPMRESVRKGVVKEAAFRTLFTHPIWKKAGVNYVDSNFVNDCKNKIPLSELVHLGMGDFMLKTPHGNISFDRVSYQFDGMSGRAHKMTGNKELMDMLIKKMRAQVVHSESVNKSIKTSINEWSSNDVLALLGGKRFLATSGAYAMSGNVAQKTAKFNFKTSGKNGINNVWITETSPDTYTINFIKVEGEDVNISPIKNVSGDKLKSIFTKYTGLKTP